MSPVEPHRDATDDEFYVGYLPMPGGLARWTRRFVPALAVVFVTSAIAIALAMRDPGDGVWDTDQVVTITGTYRASPYPLIETRDSSGQPARVLLVEEGKHGGRKAETVLDGRSVNARGHILRRANLTLLELLPGEDAITADDMNAPRSPHVKPTDLQRVTMRGEILDPKCFAGAMKPGDSKAHKGCAVLCIRGGIPPVFAAWSPEGGPTLYLVVRPDGGGIGGATREAIEPYIADWVEITGDVEQTHGLPTLRLNAEAMRRVN